MKNPLLEKILLEIDTLSVAEYLKKEVSEILTKLHEYKLNNIYKNLNEFKKFLNLIDDKNTLAIQNILKLENNLDINNNELQFEKYWNELLSNNGKKIIDKQKFFSYFQHFGEYPLQIEKLKYAFKGLILLYTSEFINGTKTRISILSYLLQKEENFLKKSLNLQKQLKGNEYTKTKK